MGQCSTGNTQSVQAVRQPTARLSSFPVHSSWHLLEEAL